MQGRELLVGFAIILSLLGAAVGTLWLKGARFGEGLTRVDVLISEVGQLMEGNAVTMRGVGIGQVERIEVEPGGEAVRLRLEIQEGQDLPEDAVVVVAPESLFGDWQAEIVNRGRYPRFDYFPIAPGRMDDGVRVLGGYALPDITRLTATAEAVSENLATLTDRVDRAFTDETAENLRLAIGNIQQVSEDIKNLIQQQAMAFGEVSGQVQQAASEVNAAAQVARSTLERTDRILATGQVDTVLANLGEASESFGEITGNLARATDGLDSTLSRADSMFERVNRLATRIEGGEGSLGRLLTDTGIAIRAEGVLDELDALLRDFRENPSRYVRLSIF